MESAKTLKAGDPAPLFSLKSQTGETVRLADFKGKKNVVLVFYPGDLTPGCTMQLCAVRDDWSKFQRAGAAVFGVNHGDAESHETFARKHSFPFPLLVDKGKKVSARYDAIRKIFRSKVIKRTVVVVRKDGKILYLKHGMPKNSEILKSLNQTV